MGIKLLLKHVELIDWFKGLWDCPEEGSTHPWHGNWAHCCLRI